MEMFHNKNLYVMSTAVLIAMICFLLLPSVAKTATSVSTPGSCTIFSASYGEKILLGNNEDYNDPVTNIWIEPRSEGNYGGVYFGYDDFLPQGGINEKGLAYDVNALPGGTTLNQHPELPSPPNEWAMITIMKKAANVEAAIEIAVQYERDNWGIPMEYQAHLADANGDAVVISPGADGELAFTRKEEGDSYLVSTNFNLANPENGGYPCWRYDKAVEMLDEIEDENDLTVDHFKSILDAVHIEGIYLEGDYYHTLYSNIIDPRNGVIYLYYWHQFYEVVTLDAEELIDEGTLRSEIKDLFSQETVDRVAAISSEYEDTSTDTGSTGTGSSGGCFVATAAFGSLNEPQVRTLRLFRDRFLLTNRAGKSFVKSYYTYSPILADCIAKHPFIRRIVGIALYPIVVFAWISIKIDILSAIITLFSTCTLSITSLIFIYVKLKSSESLGTHTEQSQ